MNIEEVIDLFILNSIRMPNHNIKTLNGLQIFHWIC